MPHKKWGNEELHVLYTPPLTPPKILEDCMLKKSDRP